ncbi:30S ribosomal protein S4 [Patescibacteria group bacterium]|nr:30S ribosomal protein S4 [Patescibacteria group bacterium]
MSKDLDSQCKKCRRAGEKLFLKGDRCNSPKCAITKRNYPPGIHGSKRRRFLTNYGQQLAEKQKAKRVYGILEKQFKIYYQKAVKKQGDTGEILLQNLEMRLDNIVFRLGLAKSRRQARQMVNHNLFTVNNKKVNIPSYQVKIKDEIAIKTTKAKAKNFTNLSKDLENYNAPTWLSLDINDLKGKVVNKPGLEEIKAPFNVTLIVEFYSR